MGDPFEGGGGFGPGGPRLVNWDPPKGSGLVRFTEVVEVDALDFESQFYHLKLYAGFESGAIEEVWDGTAFTAEYSLSSRSVIASGYHYVIRRNAGWPTDVYLHGRAAVQEIAPAWTAPPAVTGDAIVSVTLEVSHDPPIGPGTISVAYQWTRDGVDIPGATGTSYELAEADELTLVRCRVTATNEWGADSATSNAIGPVFEVPTFTAAPVASGTPTEGETLSVTDGTYTGTEPITVSYQWGTSGGPIAGATSDTYLLQGSDVGENLFCLVTITNAAGSDALVSNSIGPIAAAAPLFTYDMLAWTRASEAANYDPRTESFAASGAGAWLSDDEARVFSDGYLLVEPPRTNYCGASNELDDASWSPTAGTTVTPDADTAPDGSPLDEVSFASDATTDLLTHVHGAGDLNGAEVVVSAFCVSSDAVRLAYRDSNGVDTLTTHPADGDIHRLSLNASDSAGASASSVRLVDIGGGGGGGGFYWGVQSEQGIWMTTPIRTAGGVPGTREQEYGVLPAANVPAEMLSGEDFSFKWVPSSSSADVAAEGTGQTFFAFVDGGANERIHLLPATGAIRVRAGGITRVTTGALTWSAGDELTVVVRPGAGEVEISGAATGNGTYGGLSWTGWAAGDLYVGDYAGLTTPTCGLLSPPGLA